MKNSLIKLVTVLILILFLGGVAFGEDYADFKKLLREVMEVMSTFAEDLNSAENADQVVAAINKYDKAITPLEPRMDELDEKYEDIDDVNYPIELAEVMDEYTETMSELGAAMNVLYSYISDEKVLDAMEKLDN